MALWIVAALLAALQAQVADLKKRLQHVSRRRKMDFEGYGNDVAVLRRRLSACV